MICALMTSCKPRLEKGCTQKAIDSLKDQVEKVYVTLSRDELKDYDPQLTNCEVLWVDKDYKSFKKLLPILYFNLNNDLVLTCDDDVEYAPDYVHTKIEELGGYDVHSSGFGGILGPFTIYRSRIFTDKYFRAIDDEVIATCMDDPFIDHYVKSVTKLCKFGNVADNWKFYNAKPLDTTSVNNSNYTTDNWNKINKLGAERFGS